MKIKPLHDRVLVSVVKQEADTTKGGLYIPETVNQSKHLEGVVMAAGDKCLEVKQSDKILFANFTGVQLSVDGEEYIMLKESDILLVL